MMKKVKRELYLSFGLDPKYDPRPARASGQDQATYHKNLDAWFELDAVKQAVERLGAAVPK